MIDIFQSFNLSPHTLDLNYQYSSNSRNIITLGQFIRYLNSKSLQFKIVSEIGMRLLYSILKPIKTHRKHQFGILTL